MMRSQGSLQCNCCHELWIWCSYDLKSSLKDVMLQGPRFPASIGWVWKQQKMGVASCILGAVHEFGRCFIPVSEQVARGLFRCPPTTHDFHETKNHQPFTFEFRTSTRRPVLSFQDTCGYWISISSPFLGSYRKMVITRVPEVAVFMAGVKSLRSIDVDSR